MKDALMHSDAAMILNENVNPELVEFSKSLDIPVINMFNENEILNNFNDFIDDLVTEELLS